MTKLLSLLTILGTLSLINTASASTTSDLQPALEIVYNEDLTVHGTGRFDSAYIGKTTGEGGVTFFNGTMINASEGDVPLTMGDDLRVDGMIWRGPSRGTNDDMGLKFADSLWPALDNANDIGTSELQFKDGYFTGNLHVGDIQGNDIINTNEIATTNDPTANQLLSYNGEGLEWITVGDITSVTAGAGLDDGGTTSSDITLRVANDGITSEMIVDGTITRDDLSTDITIGDITSVTAGAGLDDGGTTSGDITLRVANDGITSAMIDDGTITGSDISSSANLNVATGAFSGDINQGLSGYGAIKAGVYVIEGLCESANQWTYNNNLITCNHPSIGKYTLTFDFVTNQGTRFYNVTPVGDDASFATVGLTSGAASYNTTINMFDGDGVIADRGFILTVY